MPSGEYANVGQQRLWYIRYEGVWRLRAQILQDPDALRKPGRRAITMSARTSLLLPRLTSADHCLGYCVRLVQSELLQAILTNITGNSTYVGADTASDTRRTGCGEFRISGLGALNRVPN